MPQSRGNTIIALSNANNTDWFKVRSFHH